MVRACNPRTREVETGGLEKYPQLHKELEANLGYIRPWLCFKAYGAVMVAQ